MKRTPEFIDVCAVEAWDTWFRWREHGELKDVSVQDTWARIARALATPSIEQPLLDALETWKLLPDERIVATAGTGSDAWPDNELAAVINVAAFVVERGSYGTSLDLVGIERTASLAVRALEIAVERAPRRSARAGQKLRVGMMGFADALALLGIPYASDDACLLVREISRCIAMGCLQSSIDLARLLGQRSHPDTSHSWSRISSTLTTELAGKALRHGLRHHELTAVGSHARLAMMANNVADAVDPLAIAGDLAAVGARANRAAGSQGYALEWARRQGANARLLQAMMEGARASEQAQTALRRAAQEWVDEPIDHPPWTPVTPADA